MTYRSKNTTYESKAAEILKKDCSVQNLKPDDLLDEFLALTSNNYSHGDIYQVIANLAKCSYLDDNCYTIVSCKDFMVECKEILTKFATENSATRNTNLEYNVDKVFKILLDGSCLENYDLKEFWKHCDALKIPELVLNCVMKCTNKYTELVDGSTEEIADSPLFFYTGILGRGFYILKNILVDNPQKFYPLITDSSLHEAFFTLIVMLDRSKYILRDNFIDYSYSCYAEMMLNWAHYIESLPFDVVETSFSCFYYILNSMHPNTRDAFLPIEPMIYHDIVNNIYAAINEMTKSQADVTIKFIESEDNLLIMHNIAVEILERQDFDEKNEILRNISKVLFNVSKHNFDGKFHDKFLYNTIFDILAQTKDGVTVVKLVNALSNIVQYSKHILVELTDKKTFCNIVMQGIESEIPTKPRLKFTTSDGNERKDSLYDKYHDSKSLCLVNNNHIDTKIVPKNAACKMAVCDLLNNMIEKCKYTELCEIDHVIDIFFCHTLCIEYVSKAILDYLEYDDKNEELIGKGLNLLENVLDFEERCIDYDEKEYEQYMQSHQLFCRVDELAFMNPSVKQKWEHIASVYKIDDKEDSFASDQIGNNHQNPNIIF